MINLGTEEVPFAAAEKDALAISLLNHNADMEGFHVLAAMHNNLFLLKLLHEEEVNLDDPIGDREDSLTALGAACGSGCEATMEYLCAHGSDIEAPTLGVEVLKIRCITLATE
ncbi:MAG: hypothetical protein Q9222_001622 [Ikaeria aurantiellina]